MVVIEILIICFFVGCCIWFAYSILRLLYWALIEPLIDKTKDGNERRKQRVIQSIRQYQKKYPNGYKELFGSVVLSNKTLQELKSYRSSCASSEEKMQQIENRIRQEEESIAIAFAQLEQQYSFGVSLYEKGHPNAKHKDYIQNEEEIKRLDSVGERYHHCNTWFERQQAFAQKSRSLSPDSWGCYPYDIEIPGTDENGEDKNYCFRIWQHFAESFCRDESLDYTYFNRIIENRENLKSFENKGRYFKPFVYDKVLEIIKGLSDNVIVLFLDSVESSDTIPYSCSLYEYHFGYLRDQLDNNGIRNWDTAYETFIIDNQQDIVIVELITSNDHLKTICKELLNNYRDNQPCITYISMLKEHTSEEMSALILQHEKRIKEQEEQKRIELERKRRIEAERKRAEEVEAERQARITNALKEAVSSWAFVPNSDLHHAFLIRYYPTNCDFNATDEEWHNRQLIWSFKNDPGKTARIPYNVAIDEIVPPIESFFKSTFGGNLSNLTLVCIPASSPEKNKARYEGFSASFCRRTGMANAYSHITVDGGRVARHLGGEAGGVDSITFDEEFFKGRNVLLFDDILTRGDSMRKYKMKMTSLGANVIAGFTIGKTFHTRENEIVYTDYDDADFPF